MKLKPFVTAILIFTLISSVAIASPTLSKDSQGRDVLLLQQKLKSIGYTITELDGIFGNETQRAVEEFQRDSKIKVTGIVNNSTWRALKNAKPVKSKSETNSKDSKKTVIEDDYSDGKLVPFGKVLINKNKADALIATAKKYIGVPYVFGGVSPSGFDCSGFLQYVFKQNGILIPRLADDQYKLGKAVKISELNAGDLVFFTTYDTGASHCGIYLGNGKFLHTSSSRGVRIDDLDNDYWSPRYYGGKQIVY